MRKQFSLAAAGLAALLTLSACGAGDSAPAAAVETLDPASPATVTVGASPVPHAQILEFVRDNLAEGTGIELEIQEFDDYTTPNIALSEGDLDANYFQHLPYFESQVESQGYEFAHGEGVHIEPYAAFSEKHDDVSAIPDGGRIAITNDPSNQARALTLMQEAGVLENIEADASVLSLTEEQNPKGLEFIENQPELLLNDLQDPTVDLAIINGNYILDAGLSTENALIVESVDSNPYANFLAWNTSSEGDARIAKLEELLHSPEVKQYIEETWPSGDVAPAF
ncbi:MetQ/NlpA family ABC transporter substrate-binding protein [Arthrobacter tumbae]|uniref:MetQ/NlpA family ABC transporter substrate-binding protein n=1 Tax=Arthrobacter tumbae TaxID=163874 RepID=UPI00195738D2|nr:MetQ/NlpA family ABC transporter substrate-binding protein [Arthrobacter tumbae]MBM7780190.1 D-methionine transport system substrate-binding protein [Arthrobacter tumbae]